MFLSTQAKENFLHYEHKEYGYNYRLSNVLAAIGVAQMEVLDKRVEQKRAIFDFYHEQLGDISEISFMPEIKNSLGNRWLTTLSFERTDPMRVIEALEEENIESRPLWKPMHMQPLFKKSQSFVDKTSEILFNNGICLPSPTSASTEELFRVVKVIKKICQ